MLYDIFVFLLYETITWINISLLLVQNNHQYALKLSLWAAQVAIVFNKASHRTYVTDISYLVVISFSLHNAF